MINLWRHLKPTECIKLQWKHLWECSTPSIFQSVNSICYTTASRVHSDSWPRDAVSLHACWFESVTPLHIHGYMCLLATAVAHNQWSEMQTRMDSKKIVNPIQNAVWIFVTLRGVKLHSSDQFYIIMCLLAECWAWTVITKSSPQGDLRVWGIDCECLLFKTLPKPFTPKGYSFLGHYVAGTQCK